jgi:hypothetical protein
VLLVPAGDAARGHRFASFKTSSFTASLVVSLSLLNQSGSVCFRILLVDNPTAVQGNN